VLRCDVLWQKMFTALKLLGLRTVGAVTLSECETCKKCKYIP